MSKKPLLILSVTLGAIALTTLRTHASESKPNIVLIMCDDLGYGDVQCLNPENGKIKTPCVDKLAKQGMIFTDAHSGSAVCTPTRYGLLTGRYSWRTRLQNGVASWLQTLPDCTGPPHRGGLTQETRLRHRDHRQVASGFPVSGSQDRRDTSQGSNQERACTDRSNHPRRTDPHAALTTFMASITPDTWTPSSKTTRSSNVWRKFTTCLA